MNNTQKQLLLAQAREHVAMIRDKIKEAVTQSEDRSGRLVQALRSASEGDKIAQHTLLAYNNQQIEHLKQLHPSPYFAKCEFEVDGEKKKMYFGKFSFSDEHIYSWVTPAASLRFEQVGNASYTRIDGSVQSGILHTKDQYMIVDGNIKFYATEGIHIPRELIYQEHFTRQKQGFILQEVVEQMEKAQDQIIRASYRGPFVISGPAGSGKTTLALHRVAYLMQSPETAEFFTPEQVLVLVQDKGTKEYFSHLLPDLGIHRVEISTFSEWAMAILDISDYWYISDYGIPDIKKHQYEYAKLRALRELKEVTYTKHMYTFLQDIYQSFMSVEQLQLFDLQKKEKQLDRFDLTMLLQGYLKAHKEFSIKKEYYQEKADGTYMKKIYAFPLQYNLMIVDEFQNYLPEQLQLMKACLNKRIDSIVYVGDLAQQTHLGTIRAWDQIGEKIEDKRLVRLQKVYRNTKQILQYIQSLGYSVTVPEELKEGKEVEEYVVSDTQEEIERVKHLIPDSEKIIVGILSKEREYLRVYKEAFKDDGRIHCLSFQEAQGVEFDMVFIVGIDEKQCTLESIADEIKEEVEVMQKDLLYVALTRAMSEMYVLGRGKLSDLIHLR